MIVDNDGVDFSTASLTLPEGTATEYTGELVSAPANTVTGSGSVPTAASMVMAAADGGTAGVTITPTTLDIVEGAAGMYTVALGTQPAGEVLVTIDPGTSATAPVTITPSLVLTFTPMTWETPQTVTVMAAADGDGEGGMRTLVHTVSNYPGVLTAASVTVVVTDDDTAGVTITPTTLDIVEGAAGMYTVALGTQPAGQVLVTIDPGTSTTAPVSIAPSLVLTFTPMTWETPQTVTVSADEDDDNENGTRTLAHTVSNYPGVLTAASVTVVVTDDDTAGVTITPTTLDIVEGAAGMYTVALGTQPAGEVLVTIDPGTSATAPVTITPSLVLTFTPMTWETPQTVTVMAAADGDGEGGMRTLAHTVSNYPGALTAASVTVVVTDDDTAGVTITPTTLDIVEGAAGMYTVALGTQPAGQVLVTIDPGTSTTAPVSITPSLVLTFTPMTWETPQTVTVSADEDDDNENGTRTLAHTVSGYTGVSTVDPVRVGVTDNERTVAFELRAAGQGLDVDPAQTGTTVEILAPVSGMATDQQYQTDISEISEGYACGRGGGLHFVVRLSEMASSDVEIGYTLSGTASAADYVDGTGVTRTDGTLYSSRFGTNGIDVRPVTDTDCVQDGTARGTGTLTIPMGETEGEIFIEVRDDTDATEGDETVIATLTSASGITIAPGQDSATGIIQDNEAQYLLIGNTYYPSRFASRPGSYANPALGSEGLGAAGGPEHCVDTYNPDPATSAFEAAPFAITFDWKAEFYEAGADSESGFAFADGNDLQQRNGTETVPANASHVCFRVPLADDDLVEDSEVFSVLLDNIRPAGMVNFYTDTGGSSAYGGRGDFPLSTAGPVVRTARSSLGKLDVVILDNDGVEFSTASLTFEEGAAATAANEYTVNLFSAPANTVTVTPMFVHPHPDDLRGYSPQALAAVPSLTHPDLTITPAERVFTPTNWATAQTFTVTSVVDSDITPDRATITHMAVGLDAADSEDEVGRVSVEITEADDQTAGVLIYSGDPAGGRHVTKLLNELRPDRRDLVSWHVSLEAAPAPGETVTVTADLPSDEASRHGLRFLNSPRVPGSEFSRTLTFTSENWNPLTVSEREMFKFTVDSITTADDDGRDHTVVVSHTVSSSGGGTNSVYTSLTMADSVTVVIIDDETDGVSSAAFAAPLTIAEAGSGTYDVVLDTDPLGTVEITVSSGDVAVTVQKSGGMAAASTVLTFTSSDWNTAQTVTVTAVADTNDVHERVELSHAVSGYGEVTAAGTVTVHVLDDEGAPTILVDPPRLVVLEGGPMKTYSMVLSKAPAASTGTVTVTPTGDASLAFTPASLEFDSTNWSAAQTLSVSLADDYTANDAADGNMELSITHEFAYGGTAPTGTNAYTDTAVEVVAIDDDRETRARLTLLRESPRGENFRECEIDYPDNAGIDPADPGLLECEARFFGYVVSNPVPLPSVLDVMVPEDFDQFEVLAKELPVDILPNDPESEFDFGPEPLAVDLRIELKDGSTLTEFPTGGLDLCLAVPDAVYAARVDRITALLYHDGDAWTDISTETVDGAEVSGFDANHDFGDGYAGQLCATGLTAEDFSLSPFGSEVEVSPYAVGFLGQLPPVEIPDIEEEEEIPEMNQAAVDVVLPVLASAVATNVIGAVARRFERVVAGLPTVSGNLGGHSTLAGVLAANERALNEGELSWQNLLGSSSFDLQFGETDAASLSAAGDAGATPRSGIGVWASGDYNSVAGSDDTVGKWDGDITSAHVGVDRHVSEKLLAGLAVSWSRGSFDFDDDSELATKTRVVSVSPYFGWTLQEDTHLWGTVGYGTGEITQEEADLKSDLKLLIAGAGGSRRVAGDDALAFAVTGEATLGKVKVDKGGDFAATTADARRLRAAMEVSSTAVRDSGDTLRYAADLGVRHRNRDGGDGSDTGFGAEISGMLRWSRPSRGLTVVSLNSWLLLLHEEEDVRDWGVGGQIHYLARPDGRGLSLQLQPVYGGRQGGRQGGGQGSLWERGATEVSPGAGGLRELQFLVDVEYGLPGLSGRVLSIPYGGLDLSRGSRSWRLGNRFEFDSASEIDLQARRREREDADPENSVDLVLRAHW